MATNTASLEASFAAPAAVDHEPPASGRKVTRRAGSNCCRKLGRKLDAMLQEVQAEKPAPPISVSVIPLDWYLSHGESEPEHEVEAPPEPAPIPEPEPASAAPPSGAGEQSADASAISNGGVADGLSYAELHSLWELVTDTAENAAIRTSLTVLLDPMEASPAFSCGHVAAAMADLQAALEQMSHQVDGMPR